MQTVAALVSRGRNDQHARRRTGPHGFDEIRMSPSIPDRFSRADVDHLRAGTQGFADGPGQALLMSRRPATRVTLENRNADGATVRSDTRHARASSAQHHAGNFGSVSRTVRKISQPTLFDLRRFEAGMRTIDRCIEDRDADPGRA